MAITDRLEIYSIEYRNDGSDKTIGSVWALWNKLRDSRLICSSGGRHFFAESPLATVRKEALFSFAKWMTLSLAVRIIRDRRDLRSPFFRSSGARTFSAGI